jgi:SAM-dependent methyltransferase
MTGSTWISRRGAKIMQLPHGRVLSEAGEQGVAELKKGIDYWNTNDFAVEYERLTRELQYIGPQRLTELALPFLQPGCIVLDLGAGTGLLGKLLSKQGFIVDGVDFSVAMLEKAKGRGYRTLVASALENPQLASLLPNQSYSAIVSVGVFGDWVHPQVIPFNLRLLSEHGTVAIGGMKLRFEENGTTLTGILEAEGFEIKAAATEVAHNWKNGSPVEYSYAVGVR